MCYKQQKNRKSDSDEEKKLWTDGKNTGTAENRKQEKEAPIKRIKKKVVQSRP